MSVSPSAVTFDSPLPRQYVAEFDMKPGLSDELTAWLEHFDTWEVAYSTYVDTMGVAATPKLVAIVTGVQIIQEDDTSGDSDDGAGSPDQPAEEVRHLPVVD